MKNILAILVVLSSLVAAQAQASGSSVVCQQTPGENEPSLVVRVDAQGNEWITTVTYVDNYLVQRIGTFKTSVKEEGSVRVLSASGLNLKIDTSSRVRRLYNRAQVSVVSQYSGKVWNADLLCR